MSQNVRSMPSPLYSPSEHDPQEGNWHIRYLGVLDDKDVYVVFKEDDKARVWVVDEEDTGSWVRIDEVKNGDDVNGLNGYDIVGAFPILEKATTDMSERAFHKLFAVYPKYYNHLDD